VTLSPDGKWLWDGTNWIPAPPTEDPFLSTQPNLKGRISNLSSRKKLIVLSISSLIILTSFAGIWYQFGFIGESIEGQWYNGEEKFRRFDSDGHMVFGDSNSSYIWKIEGHHLLISQDRYGLEAAFHYEIRDGWLFIGDGETSAHSHSSDQCLALNRNPIGNYEWLDANSGGYEQYPTTLENVPEWCDQLGNKNAHPSDHNAFGGAFDWQMYEN
jgi:hypothetical protein